MNKALPVILSELRSLLPEMAERYNVISLEIFGSFVRNEQKDQSDLDILVKFSENPGLLKFLELENYLSDKLNLKIDLVMKDSLKPALSNYILAEAIPVC